MKWCVCVGEYALGLPTVKPGEGEEMVKKRKDKPWHLKVTWTLSIVMLLLIFGFFYQSFQEVRKIAPVQVAVELMSGSATQANSEETEPD
jgi:hypothetical protein